MPASESRYDESMNESLIIILLAVLLAFINTLWTRYQLDKEKRTKKQEGYRFGVILLFLIPLYGIFAFWYVGIRDGILTVIMFLVAHFIFEKIFKLPNDASYKK